MIPVTAMPWPRQAHPNSCDQHDGDDADQHQRVGAALDLSVIGGRGMADLHAAIARAGPIGGREHAGDHRLAMMRRRSPGHQRIVETFRRGLRTDLPVRQDRAAAARLGRGSEDERRECHREPAEADGGPRMAHIGVKRFHAGDGQDDEPRATKATQGSTRKADALPRIHG